MAKKRAKDIDYDVLSVIVCDDVRREVNGKEILVGVYNGSAIFSQFPAAFPHLFFRIAVDFRGAQQVKQFFLQVHDDAGKLLLSINQDIHYIEADSPTLFLVGTGPIIFPSPTVLRISFGADKEPEVVGRFAVRHPETDEERGRLKGT
jgi:hypothetical protein